MEENNVAQFRAVAKHIEDTIKLNPSIYAVSLVVNMSEYPTKAWVTYSDGLDVRSCEIEVR